MKYRVSRSYDPENPEALITGKGEKLKFERKPTDWPGWIWCTASNGKASWIPESWAELSGEFCILSRDYNSQELSVKEGETLEVELEESGWAWVRNSAGDYGWVPIERIEPEHKGSI